MGKSSSRGGKKGSRKGSDKSSTRSSNKSSRSKGSKGSSKKSKKSKNKGIPKLDDNLNEVKGTPGAANLRKCKVFGPCKLETRQAHTAILLLQSEEDKIVLEALNNIQKFCKKRDENKEIVVECDGVSAVIKLILSPNHVIQRLSLKILSLTSYMRKIKLLLRDTQIVPRLVELMKSHDEVVVEYVTAILSQACKLYANRADVIQMIGDKTLIELITRDDPDIQKNSMETMWRLIEDPGYLKLFTENQTLKTVMKLVDSEYPAIQIIALTFIERITETPAERPKLAPFDLLNNISAKLRNMDTADLHRVCLRILKNLATVPEYSAKMVDLLVSLSDLLDLTKDIQVLILILTFFGVVSTNPTTAQLLVDIGVTQKLVSILRIHENIELREATIHTVSQFATYDFRAKVILVAAIEPIVKFFEEPHTSILPGEYCFRALSSIVEVSREAGPALLECDGLRLILKIFVNPAKYTETNVLYAMNCAVACAKSASSRQFLIENGLVAGILMVMGIRSLELLTQATIGICGLMNEEIGRTQFVERDGYIRILRTLGCPENCVPIAVLPLIDVLSKYPEMGMLLIEKGVAKAMSKRKDLYVQNALFKETLDRLLSLHLPAKFAITGRIDYSEKLDDGFYDQGYLKKDEAFVIIRDMIYDTRDPLKRVIYLNLTTEIDPLILQQNKILEHVRHHKETVGGTVAELVKEILFSGNGNIDNEKLLVGIMATVIANKMGGQVDKFQLSANSEDMELANLQSLYKSTVIPITMIKNGVHTPRALMFKALADIFEIPCSLDRGGYNKTWNTVMLGSKDKYAPCPCALRKGNEHNMVFTEKLERCVVDLVYQPGSLFPLHSYEADTYCFK